MKTLTLQEQYILLSVYRLQNNAYLITIKEHMKEFTGQDLAIGTIYAPLDRLKRYGYVSTVVSEPLAKVGGRSIKFYRITDKGINTLSEMKKIQDGMWFGFLKESISGNQ